MAIAFVQVASATPQTAQATVPVTFATTQVPGNLNVVFVGWNAASGTVSSITDSYGNDYLAAGAAFAGNSLSQAVWYAPNIVGAYSNLVVTTMPYRNSASGRDSRTFYTFSASTPLDPARTLASVTLPTSLPAGALHLFSVAADIGTYAGDPLASLRNNKGISHDATPTQANLDGGGNSYSYEALQAQGVIPGGTVTAGGITFPWPNVAPGVNDNVSCTGQTLALPAVPGANSLNFLGTAAHGNQSAWGTLTYTDGSTVPFALSLTDWFTTPPAGNNVVLVTLAAAEAFVDVRALEYAGLGTAAPQDGLASATGVGTTATSGGLVTTASGDLLVAGGMTNQAYTGAGAGYTSRVVTAPDGDIAEDGTSGTTGSYSASAPLSVSGNWLIQLAAFKALLPGVLLAHATLGAVATAAPVARVSTATTYLRRAFTPGPVFNLPFALPAGYLLSWSDTATGAANAGQQARALWPQIGAAELQATVTAPWTSGSTGVAQFVSEPLAAQSIPAMAYTVGLAMASSQTRWNPLVGLALVNGATGTLKTAIIAPSALGAQQRVSTLEQQCLATLSGVAATATQGDYLVLEVGNQLAITTASLGTFVGNKGIAHDATPGQANFDLTAFIESYSYEALAAAGVTPGAAVHDANGLTYFWPNVQPGVNDNVVCAGQVVPHAPPQGASTIGFLGASVNGNQSGTCTLKYSDNSTTTFTLGLTDWGNAPAFGNTTAITTTYRDVACNTGTTGCVSFQQVKNFYVFSATAPLDTTRSLVSVTLPNVANMRVFAITASIGVETATVASDGATAIGADGTTISGPASLLTSAQPLAYLGSLGAPGAVLAAHAGVPLANGAINGALPGVAALSAASALIAAGAVAGAVSGTATLAALSAVPIASASVGSTGGGSTGTTFFLHNFGATGQKPPGVFGTWSATNASAAGANALAMTFTPGSNAVTVTSGYAPPRWAFGATTWEGAPSAWTFVGPSTPVLADTISRLGGYIPRPVNAGGSGGLNWTFDSTLATYVANQPSVFLFTLGGGSSPSSKQVTNGSFDAYLTSLAQACKAWGRPLYFRYLHEMNGWWYPYAVGTGSPNGDTPADYVAGWRHAWNIFQAQQAYNVYWVWCPNQDQFDSRYGNMVACYPGDQYVDAIGIDGYANNGWNGDLISVFGTTYTKITQQISAAKPLMICETGTVESNPYGKSSYIRNGLIGSNGLNGSLQTTFPALRTVLWFDVNWDANDNYRLDTSVATQQAVQAVCASSTWQGDGWGGATSPKNHAAQFISPPLVAGQALAGTWKYGFGFRTPGPVTAAPFHANTAQAMVFAGVVNTAGTLVATLLPLATGTTLVTTPAANGTGIVTAWNTFVAPAYTTRAGDRLLLEIGGDVLAPLDTPLTVSFDGGTPIPDNSQGAANGAPAAFLSAPTTLTLTVPGQSVVGGPLLLFLRATGSPLLSASATLGGAGTLALGTPVVGTSTLYLHDRPAAAAGTLPLGTALDQWATCTFVYDGLNLDPTLPQPVSTQTLVGTPTSTSPNEIAQFISGPLAPNQNLGGTYTVGFGLVTVGANQNIGQWALAVIGFSGQVQSVLLTPQAAPSLSGISGTLAVVTSALAGNYITVPGDRLVLEIGGVSVAGASDTATSVVVDGTTAITTHGTTNTTPRSFLGNPQPLLFVPPGTSFAAPGAVATLVANGTTAVAGRATLPSVAALAANGTTAVGASATLPATSALGATSALAVAGRATLPATSALGAVGGIGISGTASLGAVSAMPVANATLILPSASAPLVGTATLTALGGSISTLLAASSSLSAVSVIALPPGAATMRGTSALVGTPDQHGSATFNAVGACSAIPLLQGQAALGALATISLALPMVQGQASMTALAAVPIALPSGQGQATLRAVTSLVATETNQGAATLAAFAAVPTAFGTLFGFASALLASTSALAATPDTRGVATLTATASLASVPLLQGQAALAAVAAVSLALPMLQGQAALGAVGALTPTANLPGMAALQAVAAIPLALPTVQGQAALSALSATIAVPTVQGQAVLAAVGTVQASSTGTIFCAATITASAAVQQADGALALPTASGPLAAVGTLLVNSVTTVNADAVLDATGGCFATGMLTSYGDAVLTATAALPPFIGTAAIFGSAALAANGTVPVALFSPLGSGNALLSAVSDVPQADGTLAVPGQASMTALGACSAVPLLQGQATLDAASALIGQAGLAQDAVLEATATASIVTADGALALITASGPLAAVGAMTISVSGFLIGGGASLTASAAVQQADGTETMTGGTVTMDATGAASADGGQLVPGTATLEAASTLPPVGSSSVGLPGLAALTATASVDTADGALDQPGAATLGATASVDTADGALGLTGSTALTGVAAATGTLSVLVSAAATLGATATMYAYLDPPHTPVGARIQVAIGRQVTTITTLQPEP